MLQIFKFANEEAASTGGLASLFTALGLNWQSLILNTLAFLVVVWILGKWVYPPMIKALDAKKDEMEAATRLENEAKATLEKAETAADTIVKEARTGADAILASAKADATEQIENARVKAQAQGERLVAEAHEQLSRDVLAARRELKSETARLVAEATGAVLNEKLDGDKDRALIGRSLESR